MIKVAHVMHRYLPQSQTFIWQYLNKFKLTYPIVIATFFENLDQFSLPKANFYRVHKRRLSLLWLIDNWYRRVRKLPFGYRESVIHKERVVLIHAHFGPTGGTYLPLSQSLKIPLITTFYGYDLSLTDLIHQNKSSYAELFKKGTCFLVEGPFMKQRLISQGCPEEKISIQRIALDLSQYTFKKRSWNGKRPLRLLFTGRLVEKKGLEYALRALSTMKKDYPFQLRIIGNGELEDKLHLLTAHLGLEGETVWLGLQPHRTVIEEIQSCDVLIQPSVTADNGDTEGGAPTIILEAQACGVPVISTTHADIPYITCPNESALLSPERDVESLIHNLYYLFNNSDVWPKMGKIGRNHIEKFHNIEQEVTILEKIYQDCLRRKLA
jgi:colanic acid/amylovoran biosynthesis glycosyltransferase